MKVLHACIGEDHGKKVAKAESSHYRGREKTDVECRCFG